MRLYFAASLLAVISTASFAQETPVPFACTVQPDGQSVRVTIKNPFETETHCMVNCQFSTQHAGTSFQISCTHVVQPGNDTEICVKHYEKGPLVKMTGGDGACMKPLPPEKDTSASSDDDDNAEIQKLMKDSQDFIDAHRKKSGE